MKRMLVVLAFLAVTAMYAVPAEATCYQCQVYFYYGCSCFCRYCAPTYCGDFGCNVRQHGSTGMEWCDGEEGCFEVGRGCQAEPIVAFNKLEDTWKLTAVRVLRQPQADRAAKGKAAGP